MITGIVLLSQDGKYLDDRNQLPHRCSWDKELLTHLVSVNLISKYGYDLLPPSIKDVAKITNGEPELALTIQELNALPDTLIVVRSARMVSGGKVFRMDNYEPILTEQRIEIWKKR